MLGIGALRQWGEMNQKLVMSAKTVAPTSLLKEGIAEAPETVMSTIMHVIANDTLPDGFVSFCLLLDT